MSSLSNLFPPDPNNDPDFIFSFDPNSGTDISALGGDTDIQALYTLLQRMGNQNNDEMGINAFFNAMVLLAGKEGNNPDPDIINLLNDITGPTPADSSGAPVNIRTFFADMYVAQLIGMYGNNPQAIINGTGPNTPSINNMLAFIRQNVPGADQNQIVGPMIQELSKYTQTDTLQDYINQFLVPDGHTWSIGVQDPKSHEFISCADDPSLFSDYLSYQVGQFFNNSTTIVSAETTTRMAMVDRLINSEDMKADVAKYGVGYLLFVLVGRILMDGDDSLEAGYANNTNYNSDESDDQSKQIASFNAANFTTDDGAKKWMRALFRLQAKMDFNSNGQDPADSAADGFSGDYSVLVKTGEGSSGTETLQQLYDAGDKASLDYLTGTLHDMAADPTKSSSGGSANQFTDNGTTVTKALSSSSSVTTTRQAAVAQAEQQIMTGMTTELSNEKSARQAAIDAISKS